MFISTLLCTVFRNVQTTSRSGRLERLISKLSWSTDLSGECHYLYMFTEFDPKFYPTDSQKLQCNSFGRIICPLIYIWHQKILSAGFPFYIINYCNTIKYTRFLATIWINFYTLFNMSKETKFNITWCVLSYSILGLYVCIYFFNPLITVKLEKLMILGMIVTVGSLELLLQFGFQTSFRFKMAAVKNNYSKLNQ